MKSDHGAAFDVTVGAEVWDQDRGKIAQANIT